MKLLILFLLFLSGLNSQALAQQKKSCNVLDFGAATGQLATTAIQAAVDACSGHDGEVFFPPGKYVSGTIRLAGHLIFHLEKGATLTAARDKNAFPLLSPPTTNSQLLNCRRALLYSESADQLTIEGPGVIDGSGDFQDWQNVKEAERPMAIFVVQGNGLKIANVSVQNAAMWAVVLMETTDTQVSGLQVQSLNGGTRDGLDLVDGSNIKIDHVSILSEDDSICLKSGLPSGLSHVWISHSQIHGSSVANGLKFGTASTGVLSDIHFEDIDIEHVAQAAMALESVDGSKIDGVTFKNIRYQDTGSGIFVLLGWRGDQAHPQVGSINNISFQQINGESSRQAWGSVIAGTALGGVVYAPQNIAFQDVQMRFKGDDRFSTGTLPSAPPEYQGQYPDPRMWPDLPSMGLYFRHVKNIGLHSTQLLRLPGKDKRPILIPDTGKPEFNAP